ncbi:glycosyltransferase [Agromyces badenianii]|uniref:glycosyltransferase n=1 Tax=Agromyces badenianii TaxID=2080742 RepID=UPI000D58FF4A|nr:glycosyltransferase [Agromyces badenianii]PWC04789.1 glycosyltransferase family 1 protein [Agromyces badenianii]
MTTTLRVIVDQIIAPVPGALGGYTRDLTSAIIAATPRNCAVEGIVSSSPPDDYDRVLAELPGLAGLYKTTLARRELAGAWQLGLTTSPGPGIIHAPSLFAPLRRHDRSVDGSQIVVTVHDVLAWTHPEALSTTSVAWQKGMLKRARKHADAVVVPTHALAERLAEIADFGDRIRVIGTAPRGGLAVGVDAPTRAARLGLPSEYLAVPGTLEPRKGLVDVLAALGRRGVPEIPIVVLGPESWGDQHLITVAEEQGISPARITRLDDLDAADLAVVIAGATAFIAPSHVEGSGTAVIEAFSLATPVIHSDAPAYLEVSAGAGLAVPVGVGDGYGDRLAAAITSVVTDSRLAEQLAIAGSDRSRAFSWRDSAERMWQLHADL